MALIANLLLRLGKASIYYWTEAIALIANLLLRLINTFIYCFGVIETFIIE